MTPVDISLLILAATLGWALARAGLCAVAATKEAVVEGRPTALLLKLFVALTIMAAYGGLTLASGSLGRYPGADGLLGAVIAGAAIMGLGTIINGGCYFGSLVYIGRGNSDYLFTLVGIAVAARIGLAMRFGLDSHAELRPSPTPTVLVTVVIIAVVIGLLVLFTLRREASAAVDARLRNGLLAGLAATALFVHLPGWNYAGVLASLGHADQRGFDVHQNALGLALFAGTLASARTAGLWRPTWPTLRGALRCLAGGFVMESAARMIPGGNDALLLWAVPGLGTYGLVAYAVMMLVLSLAWLTRRPRAATA
jgi:uncharacterized protein